MAETSQLGTLTGNIVPRMLSVTLANQTSITPSMKREKSSTPTTESRSWSWIQTTFRAVLLPISYADLRSLPARTRAREVRLRLM